VLIGYEKPVALNKTNRRQAAVRAAAQKADTVFLTTANKALPAAQAPDFNKIRNGTLMFVKK
jgi:hypothetical protein